MRRFCCSLVIAALAVAAGLSVEIVEAVAPPPAGPVEYAADDPAFYTVPDPLPAGTHGDLLRFQLAEESFDLTYRIMYLSESVSGTPIAVTGLVVMSDDPAPFGGYHLLLHGHGSTGMADQCAPSAAVGASGSGAEIDLDYTSFATVTSYGFALVSTDYEGVGVPGTHPFFDGVSEARSMLDAGRAARQLPPLYAGSQTAVAGFSQGGHAALWATQLAATWTPEQPIFAALLASTASETLDLARSGVADPNRVSLTVSMLTGLVAAHPEAAVALGTVLSPTGLQLAGLLELGCAIDPPPPAGYVTVDPTTVEPFASLLAANTAGTVATPTPILMFHGDSDTNIPLAQSDALFARLCAAGQVVERRVVEGASHFVTLSSATIEGRDWLAGVADGTVQARNTCLS